MSWYDAVAFCKRLSEREGQIPWCNIEGTDVSWDHAADGYRLPTEAEWEYACRARSQTRIYFGDDARELDQYAWFKENANDRPQPVGQKKPDAWGIHDMHGNVFEWCWDWFGPYSEDPKTDPIGPLFGSGRMVRGGTFYDSARNLRSAFRYRIRPEDRGWSVGFRCARGPLRFL